MVNNKKNKPSYKDHKTPHTATNSNNSQMAPRSPLDILIHTAKQSSDSPDQQSLQILLKDSEAHLLYSRREAAHTEIGQRVHGPRGAEARVTPDTLPGTRVSTQAYESGLSTMLKNSPQISNLFYSHRNYEIQNRKKYMAHYPAPGPSQQAYKPPLGHANIQQLGKYAMTGYNKPLNLHPYNYSSTNFPQTTSADCAAYPRRQHSEGIVKMSKVDKAERVKQIDSKLDYLHNLYTRQRNLYISTYKANNDLISEAFSTIKFLKDELIYVRNNCVCNYSKSYNKGCKEHTSADEMNNDINEDKLDEGVNSNVDNVKDSGEDNLEEEENEETQGSKKVALSEEDRKDIEDQQEAELIVGRYRKNKK
eukprot:GAHX01000226.1.p1 GENE.GAHX01000226.1~~GAHX01000226.1.p1  ORF type:complete len:364 (+),score=64.34 GAHX01000226.1:138-1229(+)